MSIVKECFEEGSELFDREIQPIVSIAYSLKRIADALTTRQAIIDREEALPRNDEGQVIEDDE